MSPFRLVCLLYSGSRIPVPRRQYTRVGPTPRRGDLAQKLDRVHLSWNRSIHPHQGAQSFRPYAGLWSSGLGSFGSRFSSASHIDRVRRAPGAQSVRDRYPRDRQNLLAERRSREPDTDPAADQRAVPTVPRESGQRNLGISQTQLISLMPPGLDGGSMWLPVHLPARGPAPLPNP